MWIKIGTTQYRQYDFVGRPDVIGRIFFFILGGLDGVGVTLFGLKGVSMET